MNQKQTKLSAEIKFAKRARYAVIVLFCILLLMIGIYYHYAEASDRVRLYDTSNGNQTYTGYAERQRNGEYRFYDKRGLYTGRMDKDRLYSKDGKVQQKYYLLPNRK